VQIRSYYRLCNIEFATTFATLGYMGSGKDGRADTVGFHRPEYLAGGRLNVGTGVLDYQGSGYAFGVRGLGAEGIEVANIEAMGRGLRLRTPTGFSGRLCSGASDHRRRPLLGLDRKIKVISTSKAFSVSRVGTDIGILI
jgi:hypothetical protein